MDQGEPLLLNAVPLDAQTERSLLDRLPVFAAFLRFSGIVPCGRGCGSRLYPLVVLISIAFSFLYWINQAHVLYDDGLEVFEGLMILLFLLSWLYARSRIKSNLRDWSQIDAEVATWRSRVEQSGVSLRPRLLQNRTIGIFVMCFVLLGVATICSAMINLCEP